MQLIPHSHLYSFFEVKRFIFWCSVSPLLVTASDVSMVQVALIINDFPLEPLHRWVLTASLDSTVKVWDIPSGEKGQEGREFNEAEVISTLISANC